MLIARLSSTFENTGRVILSEWIVLINGLKAPTMSTVEQFRKAVEETEKAIAQKQKQQQKQKNP